MLDLSGRNKTLAVHQTKFYDASLGDSLSQAVFDHYSLSNYSANEISLGLSAWKARTADEYRSLVDFSHLLQDITELGVSFDAISAVVRVVRDEALHVELCKRMVHLLGNTLYIDNAIAWSGANPNLPTLERVLYRITGSLCIGETLSVHLIEAVRNNTQDSLTNAVSTRILQDESFHSQVGWNLLSDIYPAIDKATREKVKIMIDSHIQSAKQVIVTNTDVDESKIKNPFGYLPNAERNALYSDVMENVIIKKFNKIGIQTADYTLTI